MFQAYDGNAAPATLGLQLMEAQSRVAPWFDRHENTRGPLPAPFHHGPVELLQDVVKLTESPHASAKLIDDAVIMLTYGASYLQDHYDNSRTLTRLEAQSRERAQRRECWKLKAKSIQSTWRTQRFQTHRLGSLKLDAKNYLQTEVVERMGRKRKLNQDDSIENLHNAPVEINVNQLQDQVVKYAAELAKRVEERRRNEDEMQKKLLREQRLQEEKRKRLLLQRKKRHEHVCRRWNYFATRLLRNAREENDNGKQSARQAAADKRSQRELALNNQRQTTASVPVDPLNLLKQPSNRKFIRRFVTKAIAKGVSRVVCAYDMDKQGAIPEDPSLSPTLTEDADITTSNKKVLRLGLLLCDLHFGIKYTGLYQRFFERAARHRDVRIEWQVFNCLKSQLPTKAQQRVLDGFLVAGGPNIGVMNDFATFDQAAEDRVRRVRSSIGGRKNRHFGRWRQRLLVLLRELHTRKRTLLGGMGLGHVLLAEALGGRIGMKEWEDGWSLLDSALFVDDSILDSFNSIDRRFAQLVLGIRYLHGEYVESMGDIGNTGANQSHGMKSWKSPGDQSFVACFRDNVTLSVDGSPECSSFVFETLGEFYDRDKATRQRVNAGGTVQKLMRRSSRYYDDEEEDDNDEDEDEDIKSFSLDTVISLEEKKKRLGITDASADVALLFLDHFRRRIHGARADTDQSEQMAIVAAVCSCDVLSVDESIVKLASDDTLGGIFINSTVSVDGHMMVINPNAFQVVLDFERRNCDLNKRPSFGTSTGLNNGRRNSIHRTLGLTLQMLRDRGKPPNPGLLHQGTDRNISRPSIRLPSLRSDVSTKSLGETVPERDDTKALSRRELIRRPSAMRPTTPEPQNTCVLTLSQALSLFAQNGKRVNVNNSKTEAKKNPMNAQRIFIRFTDEECKLTHSLMPLSKSDLRIIWLRLIAAIRIANLPNDQVAIVSRHSLILEYLRRHRPTWTYVKDCRRSDMTQRKRLKKIAKYASCADIVLLDQEFLLSNSASENEVLIKKAHAFGLEVFVAPREESPVGTVKTIEKLSPRKLTGSKAVSSPRRSVGGLSKELAAKPHQSEHDTHVVGFMLLQFSGIHGVITSKPGAAIDAKQKISAKSEAMQEVEQVFRDWQAKDASSVKAVVVKRSSLDDPEEGDDPEDFVFGHTHYDSDDSIPEDEVVIEMARQWGEHAQEPGGSIPSVLATGGGMNAKNAGTGPASSLSAPSAFAPLRPLKPRTGDEVFGRASNFRHQGTFKSSLAAHFIGEGRSRLSSIGSFRAAIRQATPPQRPLPHQTSMMSIKTNGDSGIRSPELTTSVSNTRRGLKTMSSRKLVMSPRR